MVDQEDRFETFKTWFLHNGGVFGNHVDLQYKPARGFHLCTSSAIALQSSESIVSCPRSLTISSINAIEGNDPFVSRFENGPLPSLTLFCFFLVEQYQLGRLSFWWPYLSILPDPLTEHPFETPLYYDNGDMRWLRGTSLEHSARKMEESWRQQHLEGLRQLHQTHHHRYPWNLFKWAAAIIASRSFPGSALQSNAPFKHASGSHPAPVLLPGLDLLNHSPTAKVAWQWTQDTFSIKSDEFLPSGREIFNNYAPKANEELILGYGFSLFKNSSDHCNLALGPLAVARIRPLEHDGSHTSVTGVGWVRLLHSAYKDANNNESSYLFSPMFLAHCSMAFSNAREHNDGYSSSDTELFATVMTRNKLHTACAIAMILQKQYLDILAKNVDLPAWPKNARQFYAARYRRGQLLILQAVIESIVKNLHGLIGLAPDGSRERRILRLDHILKAGPQDFLSDFRALLHVGLGTRNADRIKHQGSVDTVFTLWLCGLRLWTLAAADTDDHLPVRSELPTRTAKWLSFVCKTYGQESEIGRRWATMPASNEGESLVEGCLYMIKAAAVKKPQSLYDRPAATSGLLLWCFRVILEESFMCPGLDGQVGEENDEIMLFLEQCA